MCVILKFFFGVLCIVTSAVSLNFVEERNQRPLLQVQTASGVVQGTRLSSKALRNGYYYAYMGIPYAQPPLGPLRFRAPKWPENWTGVLNGTVEGSGCIEISLRLKTFSNVVGNEDCLYINVFSRNNPKKNKRLNPVMVYFYGGTFFEGNSDVTNFGPDLLVSKDIIVVTLNYRVGMFGFLNTEDLASPGNYGLKDQNLALQWVQKNIRNFGGDPNSVTIFGQSAGSVSVSFHLLSPKSRGLFHKAILESGTFLCFWGSQKKPRNIAYMLGVANGITKPKDSQELVDRLREMDIKDLIYTQMGPTLIGLMSGTVLGLPYSPSVEPDHADAFISKDFWYEMLNDGEFNRVPVMMGVTANESLFFSNILKILQPVLVAYDIDPSFFTPPAMNISDSKIALEVGKMVNDYYIGPEQKVANAKLESIFRFVSHDGFSRPIRKSALLMSKYIPTYFYYFSYEGILGAKGVNEEGQHPDYKGVGHVEELFYVFNKIDNFSERETDHLVRKRMLALWSNFARHGNPTPQREEIFDNIIWPTLSPSEQPLMNFLEINETMDIRHTFHEQVEMEWWEEMFKKYAVPPLRTY